VTDYPIIIERWTGMQALTIVCERCHTERVIDADEIYNEDIYECPADTERARTASTEPRCGGLACMKYVEGDRCKGCRKLGFFHDALKGCCSRACMLQAEYAEQLKERA
jgi:hypothetical protein